MKKLTIFDIEFILGQMKSYEKEYPKAKVVYNVEENCVQILFKLPDDFKLISTKFEKL